MLEVSLDWIEFTSYDFLTVDEFLGILNFNRHDLIELEVGRYGYKNVLKVPDANIYVMFNGFKSMGIHLSISGSAIDYMCNHMALDHTGLITFLYGFGNFSRIDIALDDVGTEYFSISDILRYLHKNQYSSRFKEWSFIKSFEHCEDSKDNLIGDTIYLGRRSSETFFRIYDKKLEHNYKLPDQMTDIECTRWELEAKGEGSCILANEIAKNENLGEAFFGRLVNVFRLVKNDASRKSRCSTLPLYDRFTNGIPKARQSKSKKILDIDQKIAWLYGQCAKSYAMACAVDPEFSDHLQELGLDNLTQNDKKMISAYWG